MSVESRPFARAELAAALAPFAELEPLARALLAVWPPALAGFHRLHFDAGRVILTLLLGDARELLPQLVARADALYLDGFAPARNPELWTPGLVRELARLARPGATLATWTVAGGVRSALADAGFHIEKRAGFAAKREMLVGTRAGTPEAPPQPALRHALVIGAGLAGTLAAERLAARDWDVALVEERAERSAPAAGLVRPIANLRDALNAQLSRSAFLYALQHFHALQQEGYALAWNRCGVLQLAEDAEEAVRFEAIARSQNYPAEFLAFVDAVRSREIAGRDVRGGGWWFPWGAVVSQAGLGTASFARAGERVRRISGAAVERIAREGAGWRAYDAQGRVLAEAPLVVLANASDAARLLPEARLRLARVRGQLTYVPAAPHAHAGSRGERNRLCRAAPRRGPRHRRHLPARRFRRLGARARPPPEPRARRVDAAQLHRGPAPHGPRRMDGLSHHGARPPAGDRRHRVRRRLCGHRPGLARPALGPARRGAHRERRRGRAPAPRARPRRRRLAAPLPLLMRPDLASLMPFIS